MNMQNPYGLPAQGDLFFISSDASDLAQAKWIADVVRKSGRRVFRPWADCRPGVPDWKQIEEALDETTHALVVLSPRYIARPPIEWNVLYRPGGNLHLLLIMVEDCGRLKEAWGAHPLIDLRGLSGTTPDPARQASLLAALQSQMGLPGGQIGGAATLNLNARTSVCASCGFSANSTTAKFCSSCGRPMSSSVTGQTGLLTGLLNNGQYLIVRRLGKGGMGAVYEAQDLSLGGRRVAVKEMSLSNLDPAEVQEAVDAFKREAVMLGNLRHAHLPRVYAHFRDGVTGRWYLVMDYIEGETLEDRLEKAQGNRLPVCDVLDLALWLCDALDYLHTRKPPIIFRDLKPANIMLTPDNTLYLIDFGIARWFDPQGKDTQALGSPGYAAPEQYKKATTTRSDLYALGAVLHQLLTGDDPSDRPFQFAPLTGGSRPILQGNPALEDLGTLVMRMVDLDQSRRPASVAMVKQELQQIAQAYDHFRANPLAQLPSLSASAGSVAPPVGGTHPTPFVRMKPKTHPPFPGAKSAPLPDASIYVVSAPLVAELEGDTHPEDQQIVADLRSALGDPLKQLARARGKVFTYNDELSIGAKYRSALDRYLKEATLVVVICTPALLASPTARELVDAALDERIRRERHRRNDPSSTSAHDTLLVLPVFGIDCDWEDELPYLANFFSLPRDPMPINRGQDRAAALSRVAREIYRTVEEML